MGFRTLESQMKQQRLEITRARELRKNSTDAEKTLWSHLRQRLLGGYRFIYIVDFVCLERRLVIELDGGQHLESVSHDEARTSDLNINGYLVIRFWNNQVLTEIDGVKESILLALAK